MVEEFAYREFRVRAGVRQGGGGWYGTVSLARDSEETAFSLADRIFDWPAAARRYAARYARDLIDTRLNEVARN